VDVIAEAGRVDAGAFLGRLVRLDPAALARLRPVAGGAEMWARLPFDVLVVRTLGVAVGSDATVEASALLSGLADGATPPRRDAEWRWPLPPSRGRVIETVPAAEIVRIAAAASTTLRAAADSGVGGRPIGERALRDALLDHVPIVVTGPDGERVDVSQRLVQAVVRMGFLGPSEMTLGEESVAVRVAGTWVGLAAAYGSAWYRRKSPMQVTQGVDVGVGPFR
jgi:hypothetical protein